MGRCEDETRDLRTLQPDVSQGCAVSMCACLRVNKALETRVTAQSIECLGNRVRPTRASFKSVTERLWRDWSSHNRLQRSRLERQFSSHELGLSVWRSQSSNYTTPEDANLPDVTSCAVMKIT